MSCSVKPSGTVMVRCSELYRFNGLILVNGEEGNNSINTFKPEKIKGFHRRMRRVLYLRRFLVTNPEPVAAAGLFAIGTVKIGS